MIKLIRRSLLRHPVRTLLTVGSLAVAVFLLCFLRSLVTTLESGVAAAAQQRLWVQSAVSLFVDFPVSYQAKINAVEGVRQTCKFQWFGGYYKDRENFFAQFAVDADMLLAMWPEMRIVEGSGEEFLKDKRACVIGDGLARQFGWKVGDTVPITGVIFPKADGSAWEFQVAAIYSPAKASLDDRTLYFHWDLFEKTMESERGDTPPVGVIVIETEPEASAPAIMAAVDQLFENGPQRVRTTTEAEFQRQFVTMFGNVPKLVSYLGGGVLLAILLACVNTMLMQAREQLRELAVMKALGFSDGFAALLLLLQAMLLVGTGGGLGIALAFLSEDAIRGMLASTFPGYAIAPQTLVAAIGVTVILGMLAGAVPARMARRLRTAEAMRPH
ncbi:MAG TPA: ABC transporter permease [Planctomycetota bacterium]|nr:ABC transporter permease [Planctomycetota bacterium]